MFTHSLRQIATSRLTGAQGKVFDRNKRDVPRLWRLWLFGKVSPSGECTPASQSTCGSEREKFAKSSVQRVSCAKLECDRYGESQSRTTRWFPAADGSR
jgi:hypothetical protein